MHFMILLAMLLSNKMPNREFLKKNKSNITPKDFDKWQEKFD